MASQTGRWTAMETERKCKYSVQTLHAHDAGPEKRLLFS